MRRATPETFMSARLRLSSTLVVTALCLFVSPERARCYIVCTDPGHGGDDGAVGTWCREDAMCLTIGNRVLYSLTHLSYFALSYATRTTDVYVTLEDRVAIAGGQGLRSPADIFVSMHHNSSTTPGAPQYARMYYSGNQNLYAYQSAMLAGTVGDEIEDRFCFNHAIRYDGVHSQSLYVCRENPRPAALGEPCFVTDPVAQHICQDPNGIVFTGAADEAAGYHFGISYHFNQTPIAPLSFTAATGSGYEINLMWEEMDPTRVVTYVLERADSCWRPFAPFAFVQCGDPLYTSDNVHYHFADLAYWRRTYYYRLETVGERLSAQVFQANGFVASVPSAPTNLQ